MSAAKPRSISLINPRDLHSSIARAFSAFESSADLRGVHCLVVTSGLSGSPFFCGKLISKYAAIGNTAAARSVFVSAPHSRSNVFLWNSVIRAHTQNGMFGEALDIYGQMRRTGLPADSFTFPSVVGACAGLRDLEMGRLVHDHILEMGLASDLFVGNSLINMYARLGRLAEAQESFDRMPAKDLVSWNSLISGYTANGEWQKSVEIYDELRISGFVPDCFTVESVLPVYGALGASEEGQVIHCLVNKIGIDKDRLVNNGLIAMYSRFQNLVHARRVFDMMVDSDIISWNTMIDGYVQASHFGAALGLFREMLTRLQPDLITVTIALRVSYHVEDMKFGRSTHGYILRNGYECDISADNVLIALYSKYGNLKASRMVFEGMTCRDLVSWNTLIKGYVQRGCFDEVKELFSLTKKSDIKPDPVTVVSLLKVCTQLGDLIHGKLLHGYATKTGFNESLFLRNAVLDMYSKCSSLEDALKVFEEMETRDIISWNTIISGSVLNGHCSLGLEKFVRMNTEGVNPDTATMLAVLPACSILAAKRLGKGIHACTFKFALESDLPVGNALIEMYSKCGNLDDSIRVFNHMKNKDVVTWTALVSAYGMYGEGKQALRAFMDMKGMGIVPDHVTFVAVIYACSHSGLVEEGLAVFDRMEKDYGITPNIEHCSCIVDLLSRSGRLEEAENFICGMPVKPDVSIWGALLSACRSKDATAIAERAAKRIIELDGDNTGYYVLVSNLYASTGKWNAVGKVRNSIKAKGLKKDPGYSWVDIGGKTYVFGSGDSVEQSKEVYKLLEELAVLMAKEGYVPDRKFVLHDVEEDDKREMLCGHSERLAIAFGLLNTKPGTPLQIMKNLRVCGDCHTAIKYISKIVQRELLVRDANRFHLFKDGTCSCGDHW
ncbi:hypothetical protein Taro_010225 [Colocasia esculenta]|uniref:DYW domain-containing protein n=1 Tax=Colocasia esculenta TaxID=4460 RepID=A0A843UCC4_COLES|nr:hypothetical protein [Colocasia esculenta]